MERGTEPIQRAESQAESRAYKLFLRSINSPSTLKSYQYRLDLFCKDMKLSYDEIIKLDVEDLQLKLEDWVMSLSDRGLRCTSILAHLNGIEKFLDINRKLFYRKPLHALVRHNKDLAVVIFHTITKTLKRYSRPANPKEILR